MRIPSKAAITALAFCTLGLGSYPPRVFAQAPDPGEEQITAVPNRPTLATTGEAVQRGVLEIEYGFEGGRGHQNINGLVKFGLFKNLELRFLHNPYERDGGISAMGDCGAGFKWKMFPQKGKRPTVSVLYSAFLPTAGNGLGIRATNHQALVLASHRFGAGPLSLTLPIFQESFLQ